MAESIHDWAVKLGMVVDNASISAAEKLMDNFAASTVKSNERIKASNEDRVRAEQQAQKMREGEKIRQANLSMEDSTEERKVKLGSLFNAGAVSAQLFVTELKNINAEYRQMASVDTSAIAKLGAGIQAPSFEAEASRASELANLKADIIARSRIAAQQAADEQVAADAAALLSFQSNAMRRLQDEQQSSQQLKEMRDYYRAQEVEAARTAAAQIAAAEQAAADQQAARLAAYNREVRRENNDRWKESVNAASTASDRERQIEEANAAATQQQAVRTAAFDREQRRAANDRWKESIDNAGRASAAEREASTQRETLDRQQAARTANFNREQRRAANDTWKYQQDQIGARAANARAAAAEAAQVARVNALLQQYGNHAENVAADINFLNAAHARGAISTQQHGVAVAEATRRMNAMRGGAGNMGYAIGELARGAEDFITVMATTGFKVESVGMAMRGAGNNISQATNLIAGPFAGALVGIGAILIGQSIPYMYKWMNATKDTKDEIDALTRSLTYFNDVEENRLKMRGRLGEFNDKDFTALDAVSELKSLSSSLDSVNNDMSRAENEMKAQSDAMWSSIVDPQTDMDFNTIFDFMGKNLGAGYEQFYREDLTRIKDRFASDFKLLSPKEAFTNLEKEMKTLSASMAKTLEDNGLLDDFATQEALSGVPGNTSNVLGGGGLGTTEFTRNANAWWDDPAVVDAIQAVLSDEEKLKELASQRGESAEDYRKALQEQKNLIESIRVIEEKREALQSTFSVNALEPLYEKLELAHATNEADELALTHRNRLNELQKEYGALGAFGLDLANKQLAAEIELEEALKQKNSLKEQETENENKLKSLKKDLMDVDELRMLERMTAEERKAYEWAKKRAELMLTGAASPGELEKIFAQQSNFRMAEIDLEFKKSAPAYQTAGSSLAQTTASMNSEILRGMGTTKDKDMLSELKAIKEALTNPRGGIKLVEVD